MLDNKRFYTNCRYYLNTCCLSLIFILKNYIVEFHCKLQLHSHCAQIMGKASNSEGKLQLKVSDWKFHPPLQSPRPSLPFVSYKITFPNSSITNTKKNRTASCINAVRWSNRDKHTLEYRNHMINKEMEGAFQVVECG